MPQRTEKKKVSCWSGHSLHWNKEEGKYIDSGFIPIPSNCTYVRHSEVEYNHVPIDKRPNTYETSVERNDDGKIIEVRLTVYVEPKPLFGSGRSLGMELRVVMDCPDTHFSYNPTKPVRGFNVVEEKCPPALTVPTLISLDTADLSAVPDGAVPEVSVTEWTVVDPIEACGLLQLVHQQDNIWTYDALAAGRIKIFLLDGDGIPSMWLEHDCTEGELLNISGAHGFACVR